MRHIKKIQQTVCLILLGILFAGYAFGQNKPAVKYTVQIDLGAERTIRDTVITSNKQLTALEALLRVANVETHPVGSYVFVTSINGVKSERGVTAWYYEVNSQPTKPLAINYTLKDGDIVRWIYKQDVCSGKVDKCKNAEK